MSKVNLRVVGATALALVLVGLAGLLGFWQLESWQAQREAEARDLTRLEPVPLTEALGPDDPFPATLVGQPVTVSGSWLREGTVFVAGRQHEARDGYWVVTPLAVGAPGQPVGPDDPAVLVVRGWSATPEGTTPTGRGEVVGWLQPPEGTTAAHDDDPTDDILPELRIADAIQRVDRDLYGGYVVLDAARSEADQVAPGLEPASLEQLPEVGRFTAVRNLLYAFEWWFFGAFAAFIWWRWVRDETAVTAAETAADRDDEAVGADG